MRMTATTMAMTILAATWAAADQAVVVSGRQAARAAKILERNHEVRRYCQPCQDTMYVPEAVERVFVEPWPHAEGKRVVRLNGQSIDLAYTYVEHRGKWMNLARLVHARLATDVPATLPRAMLAANP